MNFSKSPLIHKRNDDLLQKRSFNADAAIEKHKLLVMDVEAYYILAVNLPEVIRHRQ